MKVIFDTCIWIDHLRGFQPATDYLSRCQERERWISALTMMELYAAPQVSEEQQKKMTKRNQKHFDFIPGIVIESPY